MPSTCTCRHRPANPIRKAQDCLEPATTYTVFVTKEATSTRGSTFVHLDFSPARRDPDLGSRGGSALLEQTRQASVRMKSETLADSCRTRERASSRSCHSPAFASLSIFCRSSESRPAAAFLAAD